MLFIFSVFLQGFIAAFVLFFTPQLLNCFLNYHFIPTLFSFVILGLTAGFIDNSGRKPIFKWVFFFISLSSFFGLIIFVNKLIPADFANSLALIPAAFIPIYFISNHFFASDKNYAKTAGIISGIAASLIIFFFSPVKPLYEKETSNYYKNLFGHNVKIDAIAETLGKSGIKFPYSINNFETPANSFHGKSVLSETPYFTLELLKKSINELPQNSVISITRWYYKKRPAEMLRITNTAVEALLQNGANEPLKHLLLAAEIYNEGEFSPDLGIATLLVSKTPFSKSDEIKFLETCQLYNFIPLIGNGKEEPSIFKQFASEPKRKTLVTNYPLNLLPATINTPFFFNQMKSFEKERFRTKESTIIENQSANVINSYLLINVIALFASLGTLLYFMRKNSINFELLQKNKYRKKVLFWFGTAIFATILFEALLFFTAFLITSFVFPLLYLFTKKHSSFENILTSASCSAGLAASVILITMLGFYAAFFSAATLITISFFMRKNNETA